MGVGEKRRGWGGIASSFGMSILDPSPFKRVTTILRGQFKEYRMPNKVEGVLCANQYMTKKYYQNGV